MILTLDKQLERKLFIMSISISIEIMFARSRKYHAADTDLPWIPI